MIQVLDKPKVSKKWRRILCAIPGYNPFRDAGRCWFDKDAAQLIIDFYAECLVHIKGTISVKAGEPFVLELWEKAIVTNIFGWKRPDGTRRYREAFIEVPRKNGKTSFAAGIVNYILVCEDEAAAELYSSAGDKDQAKMLDEAVKGMARSSPQILRRVQIYKNRVIAIDPDTGKETGSYYEPISKVAETKHGFNSHLIINDELHVQPDRKLIDVLETSTGSRAQPLIIHITTSDYDRESICNEKYDYACKVRDGIIKDDSFLPVIYEAGPDDDWTEPKVWKKANPNLGISISLDYIKRKCKKAQESPAFENTFKRLHLNIKTEQDVRWIKMEVWDKCKFPVIETELIGKRCFAGFDLASNIDIAGYVLLFPPDNDCPLWRVLPRFYVPADNAERRETKDRVPYIAWFKQGFIKLTDGNVIDYAVIKADFEEDYQKFDLQEAAFDRWGFEALRQQFIFEGVDGDKFVSFGQGFASMSAPTKEFEKLLLAKQLAHGGHPVLKWMASNVSVEIDAAGNMKPSKKKSTEKIDGIVMTIMALGRAITQDKPKESVYEIRGIITLGETDN